MKKGNRLPERLYGLAMWAVSGLFAVFLIGLGGLVINDLPRSAGRIAYEPPYPANQQMQARALRAQQGALDGQRETLALTLDAARNAARTARETAQAWIETRKATTDPGQDAELLKRTYTFETLQAAQHEAEKQIELADQSRENIRSRLNALDEARNAVQTAYRPVYLHLVFRAELRVFLLRLAITLPLLAVAAWLIMRRRTSQYWPLYRGFVLAALYAFFFELVPYLPSYGGYVRYGVGAVLTVLVCVGLIRGMRAYLARRLVAEADSENERRLRIDREQAYTRIDRKICPDCERPVVYVDGQETNFCVHCGLTLFQQCRVCTTRNLAFNRFCLCCGAVDPGQTEDDVRTAQQNITDPHSAQEKGP